MDIVDQVTDFWTREIFQGADSAPVSRLNEVSLPELLRKELIRRADAIINDELQRIVNNPSFDTSIRSADEQDFTTQLQTLLAGRMILVHAVIREAIQKAFRGKIEQWRQEPLSFRRASNDAEGLVDDIFKRAALISTSGEGETLPADIIAIVCDASGLKPLSQAVVIESKIHPSDPTREQLVLLAQRLVMLKARFSIGRRLIAYEGEGRTIVEAIAEPEESVKLRQVSREPAPAQPQPAAPSPIDQGIPSEAAVESPLTPVQEEAPAEVAPQPTTEPAPTPTPRADMPPSANLLYNALMSEENVAFFSEVLFNKDTVAYQRLVYQISRQNKLANALTLADNELFVREIPSTAVPAVKFLTVIRENFRGEGRPV